MNSKAREKIFNSWSGISEVALIKEVATKGEHIDMCIEYWAKKRKISIPEYKLFFHDVVQMYVNRLLTERLVCKAENVLRNVQRNIKCFYYQFACENDDEELREMVLDHLRRKEPHSFAQDMQDLQFYWELLQEFQSSSNATQERFKANLRRVNLETLLSQDVEFQKRLMVELYFEKRNAAILNRLNKFVIWDFLVKRENLQELVRWCTLSVLGTEAINAMSCDLELKYCQWSLEPEMYEYALKTLHNPDECLRNCFAKEGYFFAEERMHVKTVLRRICTTESFEKNQDILSKLPLGDYLLKNRYFTLLLRDFVTSRELEELAEASPEQRNLLEFIVALKSNDLHERLGFEKIASVTKIYIESESIDFEVEQPLVSFYEFLCNEPTVASLNCFLLSSALKCIPYLKSLARRLDNSTAMDNVPTPYDFLRKFKNLDFKLISCKDSNEVASFSNERLCQKYSRKYQLNFLHYLKQQRSCYAVYYLLTDLLKHYAQITKTQLFSAAETVTEFALQHAANTDLLTHCIAFNEMLGFDTQNMRNFLKLHRRIGVTDYLSNYNDLIEKVENALLAQLKQSPDQFPLADYQALMRIVACNQFKKWPVLIMQHYADQNEWWKLLLLLQYFNVPLTQLQYLVGAFNTRTVGEHLLRALSHEPIIAGGATERIVKRHSSFSRQQKQQQQAKKMEQVHPPTTTSAETMTSSISSCNDANAHFKSSNNNHVRFLFDSAGKLDLFAIILMSTNTIPEERISNANRFLELMQDNNVYSTSLNLMKNCVKFHMPILSLLSATVTSLNVDWNWVVWLAVATDQWQEILRSASKDVNELSLTLIENCVRNSCIKTLNRSISIFYESNPLMHLTRFLQETSENNFNDEVINLLRLYLLAWSNDEIELPLCTTLKREQIMLRSIKLLLIHLMESFDSTFEKSKLLQCICQSDISDISGLLDFCLLNEVFRILQSSNSNRFALNFENLLQKDNKEYEHLITSLLKTREYDLAIRLATVLHMPISDIVYSKWIADVDTIGSSNNLQELAFQNYEDEIREHSLPPELLVNFFLYTAGRIEEPCVRKYLLLKRVLNVIKQNHLFPNESFDRDQIEYEMVLCYLQTTDCEALEQLEIYHSEYFEEIMLKERCVLYKSFLELKELAGIEDLSTSLKEQLSEPMKLRLEVLLNRLLDEGDIVEALRLQELFEHRPIDLRFVVFCMALAEGVTTVFSMSPEERLLLREVEKSSFSKFNKRTLGTLRQSGSHQGQSSPLKQINDLSDSCSTLEFEEIPSKEKRETLDMIQGVASRLKNGITIGQRIVMSYRAAMYLDKEYVDVLRTKDVSILLKSVADDECLLKLLVVSDIITSTQMTATEVAELLSFEITTAIVRPRFYIFTADQQAKSTFKNADLWGYNIDRDLHLFLELTPNTTMLGNCLLEYCDALKIYRKYQANKPFVRTSVFEKLNEIITKYGLPQPGSSASASVNIQPQTTTATIAPTQVLSHKKQNIICVEMLIKAHQCFVHECSMEGIANVLNRAKCLNAVLTNAKSWSLIVRMLIGIARYREMFYCFDALIENEQFESLLGQFDEEKTIGLRQAILSYLREYCPANSREYLQLAALHFLMYKELAEMWELDAQQIVAKILNTAIVANSQLTEQNSMASLTGGSGSGKTKTTIAKLKSSTELLTLLLQARENYTHATENYLLDNKLLLAAKSAAQAELIAMQMDLASKSLERTAVSHFCLCLINVQTRDEFRELINAELRVPQALILSRAYGYDINWAEVLMSQFIILNKKTYLNEYLAHFTFSDNMIGNIIKGFQLYSQSHKTNMQMEENLAQLIDFVKSITLKYKLASLLSLKSTVMSLINEQTMYYLKDTDYGRNESQNMPDV